VTNHLVDGSETELGHDGSELVGNIVEEVDDVLGSSSELLAKLRILGSDTNRASVQMALAHEDTAHSDERSGSKAPFFSTKQTSQGNITTSLELAISLDNNTTTKIVKYQSLVSLSQTQLPRETSVLDTSPSRGTSTTIVTRDQDVIGLGLGDTRGDDTDTDLRHKLDGDSGSRAGALKIVDQLLEILNGVNVVVRRRRDKTDTRGGVTGTSNRLGHLVARKLTTLTRLGTLSHLDLKLVGVSKVGRSDTETTRSDLLDGRTHGVTVRHTLRPLGILTTLTSVGLATKTVHGNGKSRVRLHGDGTVRHGASAEATDDVSPRLDLVDRDRSAVLKLEVKKTTEGTVLDLLILGAGVSLVGLVVLGANGVLDVGNRGRVVDVGLTTISPVVLARLRKTRGEDSLTGGETTLVESECLLSNELESHTLDTRSSTPETSLNNCLIKTQDFENLGTLVRGESRDTHLTHNLENTTITGVLVVTDKSLIGSLLLDQTLTVQLENALHSKVGVDGISTVTEEDTHVVNLTSLSGLDNESNHGSPLVADKVMVNHSRSEDSGNRHAVSRGVAVGKDNNTVASLDGGGGLVTDLIEVLDIALNTLVLGEGQINSLDSPIGILVGHVLDGIELLDGEDGAGKQKTTALGSVHLQQVTLGTNITFKRHDNGLSDRINGRVSDLSKELSEVIIEETRSLCQASKGSIVTHGSQSFLLISGHRSE
jgi:hypothetical protein